MTAQQLEHLIQDNSTLKKGDIEATLSELREQMVRELSQGHRFYIPNVGYFSLSVKLDADGKAVEKVSSGDLRLHNINFRPEASLLQEVGSKVRFRRARLTSKSVVYEEKQLLSLLMDYLSANHFITCRTMQRQFRLRETAACKWLKRFVEQGVIRREGARNAPVYIKA
ncbi:hypothetical protein HMPREF0673_01768 [Leyella stercorea DSM 18206]|uniref:HU domain-containing protein n=2 Tax=Leyella stercorea TaxID=363265 RepID=G6AYQ8_9BACT|nr:hypothetical protein HMPREF0673_01768 [Leyella stercorea DSM 18206]